MTWAEPKREGDHSQSESQVIKGSNIRSSAIVWLTEDTKDNRARLQGKGRSLDRGRHADNSGGLISRNGGKAAVAVGVERYNPANPTEHANNLDLLRRTATDPDLRLRC